MLNGLLDKEYSRNTGKMDSASFNDIAKSAESDQIDSILESFKINNFTNTNYKPSIFYPKRTAIYWADVIMGNLPKIEFYKRTSENKIEIHKNATNGFSKVVNLSALLSTLRETEAELSLDGESDIALITQGRTIVPIKIALIKKLYNPDQTLRYYHGIVNLDTGTVPWIVTKKFYYNDLGEVIFENVPYILQAIKDADGNPTAANEWVNISVDKFNEKYKQELNHKINYGKIEFPVFTMTNTGNDRNGNGTSDSEHAKDILYRMDTVENAIDAAMAANKQRVFKQKVNGSLALGTPERDTNIQQLNSEIDVIELPTDPSNPNGNMQITDRRLDVSQWHSLKDFLLNQYHAHTGESVSADAHGNNQHTFEVQSRGDNKYRRGKAKINQRIKEIKGIVECIVSISNKVLGLKTFSGLTDIRVSINEIDIRYEYEKEQKAKTLIELGLVSKKQALEMILGLDEFEAELFMQKTLENKEQEPDDDTGEKVDKKVDKKVDNGLTNDEVDNETTYSKEND